MGKSIRHINFLDLSSASEESLAGITDIRHVNLMIYGKNVEKTLSGITLKHVNFSAMVPENSRLINGKFELDQSFAASVHEPFYMMVNGELRIKPDVTVETIEKTCSGLFVNGLVYCPEKLKGIIQQKADSLNGTVTAYIDDAHVLAEEVYFDNNYLRTLQPATHLVVTGKVTMMEPLDSTLLQERIGKMEFLDRALIREEYKDIIADRLVNAQKCKISWIPAGAAYVDKDFTLDSVTIKRFERATLYVTGTLQFEDDLSQALLENSIEKIYCSKSIICRRDLKEAIHKLCADPAVQIVDYVGKLQVINGQHKLTQTELHYAKESLTYFVRGVLEIADQVDPETLYAKIEIIDNDGVIVGNSQQCGIIQSKLRKNNGVVNDRDETEEEQEIEQRDNSKGNDPDEAVIAHMNYLKL